MKSNLTTQLFKYHTLLNNRKIIEDCRSYSCPTTGLAESTTASLPSLETAPPWV